MTRFMDSRLAALKAYVPGEQPADMDRMIKLNTNENPFPPSPAVIKALDAAAASRLRLYSDPDEKSLRAALGQQLGVSPARVVVSNGSDEILALIFHGLCENGAAFADVTYGFYPVWCDMFGVKKTIVPLREDFTLRSADYADAKGTVFIANPNAPTGAAVGLSEIEELARQDSRRLVVVDEAYVDFGAQSAVGLTDKYDNLIVTQTFSKSRCLAGARVGFAVACTELSAALETLRCSFNPYNVNSLSLLAAEAAVRDRQYFETCRARVIASRAKLAAGLAALGCDMPESLANFLFVRPPKGITGRQYYEKLREKGILVRWFAGARTEGRVRLTVGDEAQADAVIRATEEML